MKSPPNKRFNHPSEIYPSLALKYAQTKEGMMPMINEIRNSSSNNLDLSEDDGN